jgi:hypothetical protein
MTPDPWCPSTRAHFTRNAYKRSRCRCRAATKANADYCRQWRRRRYGRPITPPIVSAVGVGRRIEALHAIGWGLSELAPRLGVSRQRVLQLRTAATLEAPVARRVVRLYDELRDLEGPNNRARFRAVRLGWRPPSWWQSDLDAPQAVAVHPWQRYLDARPQPLLLERDVLDDQADRCIDAALDAIDADDEAWLDAQRAGREAVAA